MTKLYYTILNLASFVVQIRVVLTCNPEEPVEKIIVAKFIKQANNKICTTKLAKFRVVLIFCNKDLGISSYTTLNIHTSNSIIGRLFIYIF